MILASAVILGLVVQTAEGAYVDVVDALNPTGYWRLGESAGATATDRAGSNNGTYGSGTTLGVTGALSGDSDTAVDFDGNGGLITVGPTAEAAVKAAVMTEDVARTVWLALQLGQPEELSHGDVAKLHQRYAHEYGQ